MRPIEAFTSPREAPAGPAPAEEGIDGQHEKQHQEQGGYRQVAVGDVGTVEDQVVERRSEPDQNGAGETDGDRGRGGSERKKIRVRL